jgi:hypothetical protein
MTIAQFEMRKIRLLKSFGPVLALLTGCSSSKAPPPDKPGSSLPLAYPVLLLGNDAPLLAVFDAEPALTTTTKSSSLFYAAQQIIDSTGALYAIKKVTPVSEVHSVWRDMGTSPYSVFLQIKLLRRVNLQQAKNLVLEVVRSPRSDWSQPPQHLNNVVAHVQSNRSLQELILDCKATSDWHRL